MLGVPDKQHREPRGDIVKGERFSDVHKMTKTLAEHANYRVRNVGMRTIHYLEIIARKKDESRRLDGTADAGYTPPSNSGSSAIGRPAPSM